MDNNSIFGPWPLANPWRQKFILISNNSNLGGKCSYRYNRQQIDPAMLGGQKFIFIANHPISRGEISSPANRPLDHWTIGPWRQKLILIARPTIRSWRAKVHFDRQQFGYWRPKFILIGNNSIPGASKIILILYGGVPCGTVRKRDEGRSTARWAHTFLFCKDVVKQGAARVSGVAADQGLARRGGGDRRCSSPA